MIARFHFPCILFIIVVVIFCSTGLSFPGPSEGMCPERLFAGTTGDFCNSLELAQASRMSRSTCADSVYAGSSAVPGSPGEKVSMMLRYRQTWSDLPDTLVPGQPFNIKLSVEQMERRGTDRMMLLGVKWTTGVLVTAGREWITRVLTNGSPIRMKYDCYEGIEPSPQLCLSRDVAAGIIDGKWVASGSAVFNDAIPGRIPDKTTFTIPKENIKDELMLVIIYAIALNGKAYVDSNYLYIYAGDPARGGVWKLRSQFLTTSPTWKEPDGDGSCRIELVE